MYLRLYASMEAWYRRWYSPGTRLAIVTVMGMSALAVVNVSSAAFLLDELDHPTLRQAFFGRSRTGIIPWVGLIVVGHSMIAYFRRTEAHPDGSGGDPVSVTSRSALLYISLTLIGWVSVMTFVLAMHNG
jgi:hypothetical protein